MDLFDNLFKKKNEQDPYDMIRRQKKRDETRVTKVNFFYDAGQDCYIWDEWTKEKMKDVNPKAVHITGKRRSYLETPIWPELIWPKEGQSAVHMYLWMINEKMDPDKITEKKKPMSDIDWRRLLMLAGGAIAIIIIAPTFL